MKRIHIIYTGRVQGVGFRYTALDTANKYKIKGWVKNLPDGGVEVVGEGEEAALSKFSTQLNSTMSTYIREKSEYFEPATGEFSRFEITY